MNKSTFFIFVILISTVICQKSGKKIEKGDERPIKKSNTEMLTDKASDFLKTCDETLNKTQTLNNVKNNEFDGIMMDAEVLQNLTHTDKIFTFSVIYNDNINIGYTLKYIKHTSSYQIVSETHYSCSAMEKMSAKNEVSKIVKNYEAEENGITDDNLMIHCDGTKENVKKQDFLKHMKNREFVKVDKKLAKFYNISHDKKHDVIRFIYQINEEVKKELTAKKIEGEYLVFSEKLLLKCDSPALKEEYYDIMYNWTYEFSHSKGDMVFKYQMHDNFTFTSLDGEIKDRHWFIYEFLEKNEPWGAYYNPRYHLTDFFILFQHKPTLRVFRLTVDLVEKKNLLRHVVELKTDKNPIFVKHAELFR
ncbi:unnamed protein product [Caenorhabditis angaria]|uniref:DUF38 domain-containing protein n=1 Tax=Caenorhabditis angaria TaxID=860376 RepID=A0A9P1N4V2_9PELO|nr:unnamed protein product [Caenorhabditis angaria]